MTLLSQHEKFTVYKSIRNRVVLLMCAINKNQSECATLKRCVLIRDLENGEDVTVTDVGRGGRVLKALDTMVVLRGGWK